MAKKEKFIPKASIGQSNSSNATQIDRKSFKSYNILILFG